MRAAILLSLVLIALISVPISAQSQKRRDGKLKAGDQAVDFTLQNVIGEGTVTLSELKGKPVGRLCPRVQARSTAQVT